MLLDFKKFASIGIFVILLVAVQNFGNAIAGGNQTDGTKISNGMLASHRPYQVQLINLAAGFKQFFCSGAIINQRWILTAAHCINVPPQYLEVIAGSASLYQIIHPSFVYRVIYAFKNPRYIDGVPDGFHDIGLLKVDRSISFSNPKLVRSIPLNKQHIAYGQILRVAGWGSTEGRIGATPRLLETLVKIDETRACYINGALREAGNKICASEVYKGALTCTGDSGGPVTNREETAVIGVVSYGWSEGCFVEGGIPHSVFTNVIAYVPWIETVIKYYGL